MNGILFNYGGGGALPDLKNHKRNVLTVNDTEDNVFWAPGVTDATVNDIINANPLEIYPTAKVIHDWYNAQLKNNYTNIINNPSLQLLLKGEDIVGDGANLVWLDSSGNGRQAIVNSGKPRKHKNAINNRNAVVFDGVNDILQINSTFNVATVIMVFRDLSPSCEFTNFSGLFASAAIDAVNLTLSENAAITLSATGFIGNPSFTAAIYPGAADAFFVKLEFKTVVFTLSTKAVGEGSFLIGNDRGVAGRNLNGEIASIMVFSEFLTQAQIDQYTNDLASEFVFANHVTNPALKAVYAVGNSLIAGAGSGPANSFPSQLSNLLNNTFQVANLGITGGRSEDINNSFNARVKPFVKNGYAKKIFIYWEGINSIVTGDTAQQAYDSLISVLNSIKTLSADNIFVLTTIPAVILDDTKRLAYNNLLRANTTDYVLIDIALDPVFVSPTAYTDSTHYAGDQTHLTPLGYSVVANKVLPFTSAL